MDVMDALEKYYREWLSSRTYEDDDAVDEQLTRDRIEKILKQGYLSDDDIAFVQALLPDIKDDTIRGDIEAHLERIAAV